MKFRDSVLYCGPSDLKGGGPKTQASGLGWYIAGLRPSGMPELRPLVMPEPPRIYGVRSCVTRCEVVNAVSTDSRGMKIFLPLYNCSRKRNPSRFPPGSRLPEVNLFS